MLVTVLSIVRLIIWLVLCLIATKVKDLEILKYIAIAGSLACVCDCLGGIS